MSASCHVNRQRTIIKKKTKFPSPLVRTPRSRFTVLAFRFKSDKVVVEVTESGVDLCATWLQGDTRELILKQLRYRFERC